MLKVCFLIHFFRLIAVTAYAAGFSTHIHIRVFVVQMITTRTHTHFGAHERAHKLNLQSIY